MTVPHCPDFLKELHLCWRDTSVLTKLGLDKRTLAAMEDAGPMGLQRMPTGPQIAALNVALEAMRTVPS